MLIFAARGRPLVVALRPPYRVHQPPYPGRFDWWNGDYYMAPTCGTILADQEQFDILAGRHVAFDDYGSVRCSDDRRVVVGMWRSNLAFSEFELRQGAEVLDRHVDGLSYAVSPNGRFIAWLAEPTPFKLQVAVRSAAGATLMAPLRSDLYSPNLSTVSDGGDAIFDAAWGDLPYQVGVFHWHPGMSQPALLLTDADGPQWVTPATARALIARYEYLGKHPQPGQPR